MFLPVHVLLACWLSDGFHFLSYRTFCSVAETAVNGGKVAEAISFREPLLFGRCGGESTACRWLASGLEVSVIE